MAYMRIFRIFDMTDLPLPLPPPSGYVQICENSGFYHFWKFKNFIKYLFDFFSHPCRALMLYLFIIWNNLSALTVLCQTSTVHLDENGVKPGNIVYICGLVTELD